LSMTNSFARGCRPNIRLQPTAAGAIMRAAAEAAR
jgi:hypothetical protein